MGLFSRRKKTGPDEGSPLADDGAGAIEPGEQPVEGRDAALPGRAEEPWESHQETPAASVGISVSSFRGLGATDTPARPAAGAAATAAAATASAPASAAPAPVGAAAKADATPAGDSIPGLRDNVLVRDALASLPQPPQATDLMNVVRQLLQGHLFLRIQGDARALLAEGKPLPLGVISRGGRQFVVAYSSAAAIRASLETDGGAGDTIVGQPVLDVLQHVISGSFEGLVLDNSSGPARVVLPTPILQRAVDESRGQVRLKTLLAAEPSAATTAEVALALTEVPLWIAVKAGEDNGPVGVAELRTETGERYLEVYSHPLEALSLNRGDQALPITAEQLGTALARDTELTGLVVNRAGPWMRLARADLGALVELAAAGE